MGSLNFGELGVVKKRESPDFRSPEVGIYASLQQTELWLILSAKQHQNPCPGSPFVSQGLSTCHDWPVKKNIVNFLIRMQAKNYMLSSI